MFMGTTIFRIVPSIMSSKLLLLKTLEINITSVFLGLKIISHFFAQSLNFCNSLFTINSIWCLSVDV